MAKNTYCIKNLTTCIINGFYTFLWTVFITHNLTTRFKDAKLHDTKLENVGVKTLVEKCSRMKRFAARTLKSIKVIIPPPSKQESC
jgi:hypothetical protein